MALPLNVHVPSRQGTLRQGGYMESGLLRALPRRNAFCIDFLRSSRMKIQTERQGVLSERRNLLRSISEWFWTFSRNPGCPVLSPLRSCLPLPKRGKKRVSRVELLLFLKPLPVRECRNRTERIRLFPAEKSVRKFQRPRQERTLCAV